MYREEVIAKALREFRDRIKTNLDANKTKQRELVESLAEHQLVLRTIATLVRGRQAPPPPASVAQSPATATASVATTVGPQPQVPPSEAIVRVAERRGYSREKLKLIAFPVIQARFRDEEFEVSRVRDLLDEMEPEIGHTYEAAWNLCNDLIREGKLKQAGIRRMPKGIVRLFKLRTAAAPSKQAPESRPVSAEG